MNKTPTYKYNLQSPELTIKLNRCNATYDTVTAAEGELLSFEFTYKKGIEPRNFGHPDDQDDGAPPEIHIEAIRTIVPMYFDETGLKLEIAAGHDITNLFSLEELERFENQLLEQADKGFED